MKKKKILISALMLITSLTLLTSCEEEESAFSTDNQTEAKIGTQEEITATNDEQTSLKINHNLEINSQEFTVTGDYKINKDRAKTWYFTIPSEVHLSIQTKELPDNLEVYVNEVYSDISLSSTYTRYAGVRQDSMDLSYSALPSGGFSIDSNNNYSIPFQVEGINSNTTSVTVINGYGSSYTERLRESTLQQYVQAAKLNVVWTLLIKDTTTNKSYMKSISESIAIPYEHVVVNEDNEKTKTVEIPNTNTQKQFTENTEEINE